MVNYVSLGFSRCWEGKPVCSCWCERKSTICSKLLRQVRTTSWHFFVDALNWAVCYSPSQWNLNLWVSDSVPTRQSQVLCSCYKCTNIISPRHLESDSIMCSANGLSFNEFLSVLLGKHLNSMLSEKWKIRSELMLVLFCLVCVFSVEREMSHLPRMDSTCTTGNTARCCSAAFSADRCAHTPMHMCCHISK